MSVVITLEDIRAYAEVDYIIKHMNAKYREKVPQKMLDFFDKFKDPTYEVKVDPYVPLQKQGLQKYALEIIALLHLKYWCEDEERKKELYGRMLRNQEKLDEQMREKYSVEKLFDNANATVVKSEDDLEKEDFTKPRAVQRYSQYTTQNEDIQDYTDVVSEETTNSQNVNNLPTNNEETPKSFFQKLKQKIIAIFAKNKAIQK